MRHEVLAKEELKTAKFCPFCGRLPVYFVEDTVYSDVPHSASSSEDFTDDGDGVWCVFAVFCLACEVNGPVKSSKQQAILFWNKRVSQATGLPL